MRLVVIGVALLAVACSQEGAFRRHIENGDRFLKSGKAAEAILEFRNAVERDELSGEARLKLAEAYAVNGNAEFAFREYVRAADLLPDNVTAQLKAATYLLVAGQYEDARTRVQKVLAKEPDNASAQIVLGNALAGLKDLDGAVAQISEAIALEPGRSQTYSNLALIKVAQGRREEARAAFQKAVDTDPKSIAAWLAFANFQWSIGDTASAEASLKRALALDANDILANRALGTFYVSTGRAALAEPHLKLVADRSQSAVAQVALADYYMSSSRAGDARQVLEALRKRGVAVAAVDTRLAGLAYAEGRTVEGHRQLDDLLRREPNDPTALLLKARWLLGEGKPEQALERAVRAVNSSPRLVTGHYVRALAEAQTRRTADAMKSFAEVLRLNPRAVMAQVNLSRLHLTRNAVDTAVLFAEEALQTSPNSLDARLALIRAWVARGDVFRAEAAVVALRARAPEVAAAHALEGSIRLVMGNVPQARQAFERAWKLDGTSLEALNGLTAIDVLQGDASVARERVDAALAARPDHPEILLLAAKVYAAAGTLTKAEETLRRAIQIDPLSIAPFTLLGQVYAQEKRLPAMRREFEDAAARDPKNISARLMAAMIVHAEGNREEAKKRYADILQLEPRTALAANNLAAMYAEDGQNLDVALQLAETASEQLPDHPEVQHTLGWIYLQRHLPAQAIRRFEQSIAVDPANPLYHYHLGVAYSTNGEINQARRSLQAALKLKPDFADAQKTLSALPN